MNAYRRFFFVLLILFVGSFFYAVPVHAINCPDVMPPVDTCPNGETYVRINCNWTCQAQTTEFKKVAPGRNRTVWNNNYSLRYTFSWTKPKGTVTHYVIKFFNNPSTTVLKTLYPTPGADSTSLEIDFTMLPEIPRDGQYQNWQVYAYNGSTLMGEADNGDKWGVRVPNYVAEKKFTINYEILCPTGTVLTRRVRPVWVPWTEFQDHPFPLRWFYGDYEKTAKRSITITNRTSSDTLHFALDSDLLVSKTYGGKTYEVYQELIPTGLPSGSYDKGIIQGMWFVPQKYMVSWQRDRVASGTYTFKFNIPPGYEGQYCTAPTQPPPTSTPPSCTPPPACLCATGRGRCMMPWLDSYCTCPVLPTSTPVPTPFCTDTDGVNLFTKGTVTTNALSWTSPVADTCASMQSGGSYTGAATCQGANCYVREYKCTGTSPGSSYFQCINGCGTGACLASCNGDACPTGQYCYNNSCRQACSASGTCAGAYHCASGVCVPGAASSSSSSVAHAPTATPYPSAPPDKTQFFFKVKMPDVSTGVGVVSNVKIQVRDGGSVVTEATLVLERIAGTDFFKNSSPLNLDVPQAKNYTLLIKQLKTIRRSFTGVRLAKGETTDCAKDAPDTACGSLKTPHLAPLLSGDSDGFNDGSSGTTASGSFNRVDSADLTRMVAGYKAASLPAEPNADFNLDRKIDILDLAILGKNYGKTGE